MPIPRAVPRTARAAVGAGDAIRVRGRLRVLGSLAVLLGLLALLLPDVTVAAARSAGPARPGVRRSAPVQPLVVDPAVARAWAWIAGQRGSGTPITGASTIAADRDYPADWTGPVSGTFVPHGADSPRHDGVYTDWDVRAYVVTDTAYLVGEQSARGDGTFAFADSRPGTKIFQLVDRTSGSVLAEQAPDFGLVRSAPGSATAYTYDQALTVIAAVADRRPVDTLARGLVALQRPGGGFVQSADVRNPTAGNPVERTGICAVATYALLRAARAETVADPNRASVLAAARSGVDWLLDQQRADGLLGAGTDAAWVSTEHNLDAWQALHLAAGVLGGTRAGEAADAVRSAIVRRLWDNAGRRFRQGIAPDGTPDDTDPLDVNAWGSLFLRAAGLPALADRALAHVAAFASTVDGVHGYRSYYPQAAFPDAAPNVWSEGTAGVATAASRTGDATSAEADRQALAHLQSAGGGVRCAARPDAATEMVSTPCLSATAWFVLASTPDSIWT